MKQKTDYKKLFKSIFKWCVILAVFFGFFWIRYDIKPMQVPSFMWSKTKAFGRWLDTEIGYFIGSTKKLKNNLDNEMDRAEKVYNGEAYLEVPDPTIK